MDLGWLFFCVSELQEWEKGSGQVEEYYVAANRNEFFFKLLEKEFELNESNG